VDLSSGSLEPVVGVRYENGPRGVLRPVLAKAWWPRRRRPDGSVPAGTRVCSRDEVAGVRM